MNEKSQPNAYPFSPERESRVAAALRENLRKRKAQQQAKEDTVHKETK
jgi:hypothetical protein